MLNLAGKKLMVNVWISWFSICYRNEKDALKLDINVNLRTAADSISLLCFRTKITQVDKTS